MNRGFTLIELIIVFAIIGIISTIGINLSINYNQNQGVVVAAQNLKSTLFSARSQAQSGVSVQCTSAQFTGIKVRFCNSTDKLNNPCTSTQCHNNGDPDYEMDLTCGGSYQSTFQMQKLPANVTIKPDNCTVLFQPLNGTPDATGNVVVSGYGNNQTISINQSGVIQ